MVIRKALVALASAGLVFGSTAAAAAPAVADARAASPVAESDSLAGGSWAWILAAIIAIGVIGVIAADSDDEVPVSP